MTTATPVFFEAEKRTTGRTGMAAGPFADSKTPHREACDAPGGFACWLQ
jgi:hypothetical protein